MIPALATGSSFSWLLCLCDILPSLWVCLFICFEITNFLLSYFLALQDASGSSCIFTSPVSDSVISLKNTGSFYRRMTLETKIWVLSSMTFFKVLSCPLHSTPTNVTWHIQDAAMTANNLYCPDRWKDPHKNWEDNESPSTVNSSGDSGAPTFESFVSYAEPSSTTLPRSCCTCISFVWHLWKGVNYLNISRRQRICQESRL